MTTRALEPRETNKEWSTSGLGLKTSSRSDNFCLPTGKQATLPLETVSVPSLPPSLPTHFIRMQVTKWRKCFDYLAKLLCWLRVTLHQDIAYMTMCSSSSDPDLHTSVHFKMKLQKLMYKLQQAV